MPFRMSGKGSLANQSWFVGKCYQEGGPFLESAAGEMEKGVAFFADETVEGKRSRSAGKLI